MKGALLAGVLRADNQFRKLGLVSHPNQFLDDNMTGFQALFELLKGVSRTVLVSQWFPELD